jgi:penicillin-binding protein 2
MKNIEFRRNVIIYLFIITGVVLMVKLIELQILDKNYRERARRTTLQTNTIYPSRGLIYDRNGELLVTNVPIYEINAIYRNVDPKMDTVLFCQLLQIDKETFVQNLNKDWKSPQYHKAIPFTFLTKIKPEQFARFQEHLHKFPGFYPVFKSIRTYPQSNAAHVLGYLGEVNKEMIEKSEGMFSPGDFIGISGLEKIYDTELRGFKGVNYFLKDHLGRTVGSFQDGRLDSTAVSGLDIITTLDIELQQYGEELMEGKRGSIVVIEPETGEILAMISSPGYDPNMLRLDSDRGEAFGKLLSDTINRPFLDRTVMAKYPPGSIFKPVVGLIAMQMGVSEPNRYVSCGGVYFLDSRGASFQKCRLHPAATNIGVALQYSCNSYFFQLTRDMVNKYGHTKPGIGLDSFVSYLNDFGLGRKLGVDYSYENAGFIPDSRYYDKLYRKAGSWRATYMLSIGIGQGEVQITTLQMANLAAIIANRGHYYTPHLVKKLKDKNTKISDEFLSPKHVRINKNYFEPVVNGMAATVLAGTGTRAYVPGLSICGKTGTSENPFGEDHSVFFGFAPKDKPKVAIAVFVENAGGGGTVAAPIAGLMMEKYLNKTIDPYRKYLEDRILSLKLIQEKQTAAL